MAVLLALTVGLMMPVAMLGWLLMSPHQERVVYEGRSVDDWLNAGFVDASRALHELGPAAVPGIFQKLRREHPRHGHWQRYRSVWQRVPGPCKKLLPRPRTVSFDEWRACNALMVIGPRVIPTLAAALNDRNALVRSTSAQALGLLRERGGDIGKAVPALRGAVRDRNAEVRFHAANALAGKG